MSEKGEKKKEEVCRRGEMGERGNTFCLELELAVPGPIEVG